MDAAQPYANPSPGGGDQIGDHPRAMWGSVTQHLPPAAEHQQQRAQADDE